MCPELVDHYIEPSIIASPSPTVTPFTAPLHVMRVAEPINPAEYDLPPDPERHQRWDDFLPELYYREIISEFRWKYHHEPPYGDGTEGNVGPLGDENIGSWSWGFNGQVPGETYYAYYGEPIFLRRENWLPEVGEGNVPFALPSTTIHLHNAHTASESDGIPMDFSIRESSGIITMPTSLRALISVRLCRPCGTTITVSILPHQMFTRV